MAAEQTSLAKWRKRAVLAGVIVALICKALPHDYQAVCQAVSTLCSGGL